VIVTKGTFAKKVINIFTEGKYLVLVMVNFLKNKRKKVSIVLIYGKYLALIIFIFKRLVEVCCTYSNIQFLLIQWHRRHIILFFLDGVFHDRKLFVRQYSRLY
jgi:hypothetical protein